MTVIEDHLRQKALETENQKMKSDRVREVQLYVGTINDHSSEPYR